MQAGGRLVTWILLPEPGETYRNVADL